MIEIVGKLRVATEHEDEPLTLTWKSWTSILKGKCPARRVTGDLKTYLTKCLFAEPLNLTFNLYSEGQLKEFIETDEFFSLATDGGYFIVGDRDGDFVSVSLDDQSVALIPGWSITEGTFSKEKRYKSLMTFLRGEIKRAKEAIADERASERLRAEFDRASEEDPNAVDEYGFTKYHRALLAGDLEAAQRELDRGAKYNTITGNGRLPLEMAMTSGNLDLVRLLLDLGCDPNVSDGSERGLTIMHGAAMHSTLEMVRILHASGGDLDRGVGEYGETPMQTAIFQDKQGIVEYLLEQGVDPSKYLLPATTSRHGPAMVALLLQHGADPNANEGEALKDVVLSRKANLAEQLLAAGADVGHVTGMLGSIVIDPDMKQVLQAAGADID